MPFKRNVAHVYISGVLRYVLQCWTVECQHNFLTVCATRETKATVVDWLVDWNFFNVVAFCSLFSKNCIWPLDFFLFFFQTFHCAASHYSHSLLPSLVDAFLFCVACTYYKYLTRTSGRAQSVLITHTLARKGSLSIEFRFLLCLQGVVAVGVISCFVNGGIFFQACGIYTNSKERVGQCTCRQRFHVVSSDCY